MWLRVFREVQSVAVNPEPDPTGRFVVLSDNRRAFRISDQELARIYDSPGKICINPEVAGRRFRDHQTTCAFRFPTYSVAGAIRPSAPNSFQEHREELRQIRIQFERSSPDY